MSEIDQGPGLDEQEFAALLQKVGAIAPLLGGLSRPVGEEGAVTASSDRCGRREALLCALKPYLSQSRCAAVDYLIRLWRVGDAIKALR